MVSVIRTRNATTVLLATALNSCMFKSDFVGLYIPNVWNVTRHTAAISAESSL